MKTLVSLIVIFFFISFTGNLRAQEDTSERSQENLFVFLDCNARNCDFDHFRLNIPWVNWVRDRTLRLQVVGLPFQHHLSQPKPILRIP